MTKMDNNNTYNVLGAFVMGLKQAQDMFSEVGELSIAESSMGPVLQLKDRVHGWRTYFWKNGVTTFTDKVTADYVAGELGFSGNFEVTAWLVGKASVMVQVIDTNTRPETFIEEQPITDALEMGFSLGMEEDELYLFLKDDPSVVLQEGDEVTGEYKRNFLSYYNPYHWVVTVEKIELDKVVCRCTHVADYRVIR